MKYSEIKKLATDKLSLELLNEKGFILKKGGLGGGFGFYNHNIENRSLFLSCSISIYGETSIVRSIGGGIIFKEIEYLLIPLLVKTKLMGESADKKTNTTISINKIPGFENLDYSKYQQDIIITDETGVDILVERMKEFYLTIASPAFSAFTSIEQLVPMIANVDVFKINEILHYGILKKAIIYRLCNVKEYEEYINERISLIKKSLDAGDYDPDTPKWYNTFVELKDLLDNTPPKYNL